MARGGRIIDAEEEDEIYPLAGPARKVQAAVGDPHRLLAPKFTAHVPVPTQQEALLRKRKQELEKYADGAN